MKLISENTLDVMFGFRMGVSHKLAIAGKIPYIALPDGSIRFDKEVIDRMLRDGKVGQTPIKELLNQYENEIGIRQTTDEGDS